MEFVVILIVIAILLISVISYFYIYHDLSGSHYANYISTLTLIGSIVLAIIFFYQYKVSNDQTQDIKTKELIKELQADQIDFEQLFMKYYPYLSRLYKEIYSDDSLQDYQFTNKQIVDRNFYEAHMCGIMFQIIENIYLHNIKDKQDYNGIDNPRNAAWIHKWKSWFKSSIVSKYWQNKKHYFGSDTQQFIETNLI